MDATKADLDATKTALDATKTALLYEAKKYGELDIKHTELLKKYAEFETKEAVLVTELIRLLGKINVCKKLPLFKCEAALNEISSELDVTFDNHDISE